VGFVEVPEYGVCGKPSDFDPLISEELLPSQASLPGRAPSRAPRQRAHKSVRCAASFAHLKWRFANAQPDPDLTCFSNAIARDLAGYGG